ncbi:MAG: N-acetylmuramoyl-L-alanine amidase [Chitinophagaceae bacterium]
MKLITATFLLILLLGCSSTKNPYMAASKSNKKQAREYAKTLQLQPLEIANDTIKAPDTWVGTTNFNMRKPNFVIIHHTAQNSCDQTLKTFTMVKTQVSAHYVICRDGTVHHMLNDWLRAWHGGAAKWGNNTDINSSSIGIEIDNNGFEPFSEQQVNSLLSLLARLKKDFSIPTANFIGHADIAPGRKNDPSRLFPWKKLSQQGFGNWYDTTYSIPPPDFNALQALRIIGYDIKRPQYAIQSYKIHFSPQDTTTFISDGDKKILYDLLLKSE